LSLSGLLFWLQLIVVALHLITCNDMIQETVTFGLIGSAGPDKLACSVLSVPALPPLYISTEADVQLHMQFPDHNLLIHVDGLIKMLFILWCDSCAWQSRTWLIFHLAVITAEMYNPLSHCAHIHCLVL